MPIPRTAIIRIESGKFRAYEKSISETDMKKIQQVVESKVKAPYVKGYISMLGGVPSYMLTISKDKKSKWENGILQNSRYANFMVEDIGKVEMISGNLRPPMRKASYKSADDLVRKLNAYLSKAD